jgi:hypothetical protein
MKLFYFTERTLLLWATGNFNTMLDRLIAINNKYKNSKEGEQEILPVKLLRIKHLSVAPESGGHLRLCNLLSN